MVVLIRYQADRARAERILLDAAKRHAAHPSAMAAEAKCDLQHRFGVEPIDLEPRVFYRLIDNWLEVTVRFIVDTHRIRDAKDAMIWQDHRRIRPCRHRDRFVDLRHRPASADQDPSASGS